MSSCPAERVIAVIPARIASTRLPRKVLRTIAGMPMLGWIYNAAKASAHLQEVWIATDSKEVADYAASQGWPALMTSSDLASGTDRVHAASRVIDADIYVNLQGDEPLLRPEHIDALVQPFSRGWRVEVATLATPCSTEEARSPNVVKVVTQADGDALYFSRAAIPFYRDENQDSRRDYLKHLGLYAYRKAALERFASLPPSRLELAERLEQLRLLENGIGIHVEHTPFDTIGVDTEEDLRRAEEILSGRHHRGLE